MNYYEILGIDITATDKEIKKAYNFLSKKYHPDLNPDNLIQAENMMKNLNKAYEVLSDSVQREEYDQSISNKTSNNSTFKTKKSSISEVFNILGIEFKVDETLMKFNKLKLHINEFTEVQLHKFMQSYNSYSSLDSLISNIENILNAHIHNSFGKIAEILVKVFNIDDVSIEKVFEKYFYKYFDYSDLLEKFVSSYAKIVDAENYLEYQREFKKATRSKWHGRGVYGSMTAGTLNLVSSGFSAIGRGIEKSVNDSKISKLKYELLNDINVKKAFRLYIKESSSNLITILSEILSSYNINDYMESIYSFDSSKANAIFNNTMKYTPSSEEKIKKLIECISYYPYEPEYYVELLNIADSFDNEIIRFARYFGHGYEIGEYIVSRITDDIKIIDKMEENSFSSINTKLDKYKKSLISLYITDIKGLDNVEESINAIKNSINILNQKLLVLDAKIFKDKNEFHQYKNKYDKNYKNTLYSYLSETADEFSKSNDSKPSNMYLTNHKDFKQIYNSMYHIIDEDLDNLIQSPLLLVPINLSNIANGLILTDRALYIHDFNSKKYIFKVDTIFSLSDAEKINDSNGLIKFKVEHKSTTKDSKEIIDFIFRSSDLNNDVIYVINSILSKSKGLFRESHDIEIINKTEFLFTNLMQINTHMSILNNMKYIDKNIIEEAKDNFKSQFKTLLQSEWEKTDKNDGQAIADFVNEIKNATHLQDIYKPYWHEGKAIVDAFNEKTSKKVLKEIEETFGDFKDFDEAIISRNNYLHALNIFEYSGSEEYKNKAKNYVDKYDSLMNTLKKHHDNLTYLNNNSFFKNLMSRLKQIISDLIGAVIVGIIGYFLLPFLTGLSPILSTILIISYVVLVISIIPNHLVKLFNDRKSVKAIKKECNESKKIYSSYKDLYIEQLNIISNSND